MLAEMAALSWFVKGASWTESPFLCLIACRVNHFLPQVIVTPVLERFNFITNPQ